MNEYIISKFQFMDAFASIAEIDTAQVPCVPPQPNPNLVPEFANRHVAGPVLPDSFGRKG